MGKRVEMSEDRMRELAVEQAELGRVGMRGFLPVRTVVRVVEDGSRWRVVRRVAEGVEMRRLIGSRAAARAPVNQMAVARLSVVSNLDAGRWLIEFVPEPPKTRPPLTDAQRESQRDAQREYRRRLRADKEREEREREARIQAGRPSREEKEENARRVAEALAAGESWARWIPDHTLRGKTRTEAWLEHFYPMWSAGSSLRKIADKYACTRAQVQKVLATAPDYRAKMEARAAARADKRRRGGSVAVSVQLPPDLHGRLSHDPDEVRACLSRGLQRVRERGVAAVSSCERWTVKFPRDLYDEALALRPKIGTSSNQATLTRLIRLGMSES